MVDCTKCKHFIYCEFPQIVYYKTSGEDCEEYEEKEVKKDD